MKHLLLTTIAAVLLEGWWESPKDIWEAAEQGDIEAVKQHLAAGTNVDARDAEDKTPLQHVVYWGTKKSSHYSSPKVRM